MSLRLLGQWHRYKKTTQGPPNMVPKHRCSVHTSRVTLHIPPLLPSASGLYTQVVLTEDLAVYRKKFPLYTESPASVQGNHDGIHVFNSPFPQHSPATHLHVGSLRVGLRNRGGLSSWWWRRGFAGGTTRGRNVSCWRPATPPGRTADNVDSHLHRLYQQ